RAAAAALVIGWMAAAHAATTAGIDLPAHSAPVRLADTGFADATRRPFSPQYPLWSDGAAKARWVYLPEGATIDTSDPGDWKFPVGTKFWKQFTFNGKKVETRFLWHASATEWIFATYVWNEEGTNAVLAPDTGVAGAVALANGRRHDIPGRTDCRACHGEKRPGPLGFNALPLS